MIYISSTRFKWSCPIQDSHTNWRVIVVKVTAYFNVFITWILWWLLKSLIPHVLVPTAITWFLLTPTSSGENLKCFWGRLLHLLLKLLFTFCKDEYATKVLPFKDIETFYKLLYKKHEEWRNKEIISDGKKWLTLPSSLDQIKDTNIIIHMQLNPTGRIKAGTITFRLSMYIHLLISITDFTRSNTNRPIVHPTKVATTIGLEVWLSHNGEINVWSLTI